MTVFWRYWLVQIPGWILLGALLAAAHHKLGLSRVVALAVFALWFVKDCLLYPIVGPHLVRREPDPLRGILGEEAVAAERLAPKGYVTLRGELWMAVASSDERAVAPGDTVIIEAVDGLTLKVRRSPVSR